MAMYFMSGDTFLRTYIEEDPKKVLNTQFILVSETIRKTGEYEKQCINATKLLFPRAELIVDYEDYKHDKNYKYEYIDQLSDHKAFFATLISGAIRENMTIVFLCGKREAKYRFFNIMQKYIFKKFGYYIYDYKAYKEGKEEPVPINVREVLEKVDKCLKKAKKKSKELALSNEHSKKKYIEQMSKKDMAKTLDKMNLYYDGMPKSEMIEMLELFL